MIRSARRLCITFLREALVYMIVCQHKKAQSDGRKPTLPSSAACQSLRSSMGSYVHSNQCLPDCCSTERREARWLDKRNMGTWHGQMKLCWRCGVSICACLLRSNVADTSTFCVLFTGESTFFVQRLPRSFLAVAPTVHLPARKISQKVLQLVICQDFRFSFQFQFSISFSKIF